MIRYIVNYYLFYYENTVELLSKLNILTLYIYIHFLRKFEI